MKKKILNIDGGGVKVYLPLLILNYIEKQTNKKIIDIFDFYAGVSASSIILSGLLIGYSVEDMLKMFKDISYNIFSIPYRYRISSAFGLLNAKYPDEGINSQLEKLCNNVKLSDIKKPLSILTYDINSNLPINYSSIKDNDILLWKVIRASSSAPTYFSSFDIDEYTLIDGGMVVNNMCEYAFMNALEYFGNDCDFIQLSLGTGIFNKKNKKPNTLLDWFDIILTMKFNISTMYENVMIRDLVKNNPKNEYNRFDFNLESYIGLDDYTAFDKMDNIFDTWLEDNKSQLDKFILDISEE
jgi:patatin-like phospholipase/acyl hydrolase